MENKNTNTRPTSEYLAVDAACSGNPSVVEYRGVLMPKNKEYFRVRIEYATNNIGEFLAIVHGYAQLHKDKLNMPIYSDSQTAITWVKKEYCGAYWDEYDERMWKARLLVDRALRWLETWKEMLELDDPIKWQTKQWGEIPADFGRKGKKHNK